MSASAAMSRRYSSTRCRKAIRWASSWMRSCSTRWRSASASMWGVGAAGGRGLLAGHDGDGPAAGETLLDGELGVRFEAGEELLAARPVLATVAGGATGERRAGPAMAPDEQVALVRAAGALQGGVCGRRG